LQAVLSIARSIAIASLRLVIFAYDLSKLIKAQLASVRYLTELGVMEGIHFYAAYLLEKRDRRYDTIIITGIWMRIHNF
jgi:hypothetical protein